MLNTECVEIGKSGHSVDQVIDTGLCLSFFIPSFSISELSSRHTHPSSRADKQKHTV